MLVEELLDAGRNLVTRREGYEPTTSRRLPSLPDFGEQPWGRVQTAMRKNLETMKGKRMRFTALVERFGSKPNWHGFPETTILLKDVRFADTAELACDHLWFKHGKWAMGLVEGHKFAFDARVDSYAKGYQGAKAER
jgi:hypothetical protein